LAVHGLGADLNVYAYVSGHALKAIDPFGLEEKAFAAALLERAGVGSADAKFVAKLVYFANPSAAVADRIGIGTQQTTTALKKGNMVGAAAAVGRTVKDVTGAGTGVVESVVREQLDTSRAASAVTQLALGQGSAVKHLDTLADFALQRATTAVAVASAGAGAGASNRAIPRSAPRAPSLSQQLAALDKMAADIHSALDPIAQKQRTTAVLLGEAGGATEVRVLAGGKRDLTPAQRALAGPGDVTAKSPGSHAEITALKHAGEQGIQKKAMVTTRDFCPDCRQAIESSGGEIVTPRAAVWTEKQK